MPTGLAHVLLLSPFFVTLCHHCSCLEVKPWSQRTGQPTCSVHVSSTWRAPAARSQAPCISRSRLPAFANSVPLARHSRVCTATPSASAVCLRALERPLLAPQPNRLLQPWQPKSKDRMPQTADAVNVQSRALEAIAWSGNGPE